MTICSAKNCKNTANHLFPLDSERREQWKRALRRKGWQPSKYSRLCSVHFKPEDFFQRNSYTGDLNFKKVLRKTAVPSIFSKVQTETKKQNSRVYKSCAVPLCRNTAKKSPNKLFVTVPKKKAIRDIWLKLARVPSRDTTGILTSTVLYFCEDHFDMPNDMTNYLEYKLMGAVRRIQMKPGCLPTKYQWQTDEHTMNQSDDTVNYTKYRILKKRRKLSKEPPDERTRKSDNEELLICSKRQRKKLVEECVEDLEDRTDDTAVVKVDGTSCDSSVLQASIDKTPQEVSYKTADKSTKVYSNKTFKLKSEAIRTEMNAPQPERSEQPSTSKCTTVTAGTGAGVKDRKPPRKTFNSKKSSEANSNKMFLTVQPISFRCRLCAKNYPYDDRMHNLSNDEKAKRAFIEHLKYFGGFYNFFGDFRNKYLPDIVCGACFDALDASHNFFLKMVYAKMFFNQWTMNNASDNEDPLGEIATEDNEIEIQDENDTIINDFDIEFSLEEHDIKSKTSEETVSIKSEPIDDNDIEIEEENDIYVNENDTLINEYDNDISIEDHDIKTEVIEYPMMTYKEEVNDSKSEIPHCSKTGQKSTVQERMDKAIEDINNTVMDLVSAEKLYIRPRNMSLSNQVAVDPLRNVPHVPKTKTQYKINHEIEKKLINYLKILKERRFCFRLDDVVATLLKLYDMTDLPHPFKRGQVANEWCEVFLESNKDIFSKEQTDPNDRPYLMKAFDIYRDLVTSLNLGPDRIYNAVESAAIGLHETVFSLNAVCGISASGTFIPPIVFVKNHDQDQKLNYEEPTVVPVLDASVRMTANRYLTWLKHFQKHTQSTVKNKAILITNGHPVHKDILALNFAKENGIELCCLSVFHFQPLADFYEELKKEFTKELEKVQKHLLQNSAFVNIFFYVYYKMATKEMACKGFHERGLWPLDSDVFSNVILEYRRKHHSV